MPIPIKADPEFTRHMVDAGYLARDPFVFVDVGAAGGFRSKFDVFGPSLMKIGFEPDTDGYETLNEQPNERIFQKALGNANETRPLYLTRSPFSHSMLKSNSVFWKRMWSNTVQQEVGQTNVDMVRFDDLSKTESIGDVDYMKIDTESTELEILRGAETALRESVIAVECEVAFYLVHHERCLFADVDYFLRELGFSLYALETVNLPRRVTPTQYLTNGSDYNPDNPGAYPKADFGHIIGGDALYIADFQDGCNSAKFDSLPKLLKTAGVFDIHNLPDCALELIESGVTNNIIPDEVLAHSDRLFTRKHSDLYEDIRKAGRHFVPSFMKPLLRRVVP
ncbi:MAG: FkbM family methyltransferase [Dehalococcoidia bacterium]|jgi:FkbM family methyltransferase|nr:FkbM family methyltransferase [Dehalococcoidia bacterium]